MAATLLNGQTQPFNHAFGNLTKKPAPPGLKESGFCSFALRAVLHWAVNSHNGGLNVKEHN